MFLGINLTIIVLIIELFIYPMYRPYPPGFSFRLLTSKCVVTSGNWLCRVVCGSPRKALCRVMDQTSARNAYWFSRAIHTVASTSILLPLNNFVSDATIRAYFISSGNPDFLAGLYILSTSGRRVWYFSLAYMICHAGVSGVYRWASRGLFPVCLSFLCVDEDVLAFDMHVSFVCGWLKFVEFLVNGSSQFGHICISCSAL